MFSMLRRVRVS